MRYNIIRKTLMLAIGMILAQTAVAQIKLPQQVEVTRPKQISDVKVKESDLAAIRKEHRTDGGVYWIVYSDRDRNELYSAPNKSSKTGKTLSMGEELCIAKIENDFALVYTEPSSQVSCPDISSEAKARGWVPMDNLLLWPICPVDEYGICKKALIVANLDKMSGKKLEDFNQLRKNPESSANAEKVSSQRIYFVMKEQKCADGKKRALLSFRHKMEENSSNKDITLVGWVEDADYVPWTQRSCLEQNTNRSDLEGGLKGTKIKVCGKSDMKSDEIVSWDVEKTDKRPEGEILRFPILENDTQNDNLFKITYFGAHKDPKHYKQNMANAQEQLKKAKQRSGNVNLILVIDATTSMSSYYEPIKNALHKYVTDRLSDLNVKVGVVLYRDKVDEYPYEYCPVEDIKKGTRWSEMLKGGKGGIISSKKDRTQEEDMLTGLEVALNCDSMHYNAKEQNIIMLVGDCGNESEEAKERIGGIVDKMVNNSVQLLIFQVHQSNTGAFNLFRLQANNMLRDNISKQLRLLGDSIKPKYWRDMHDQGRTFKIDSGEENDNILTGALRYPQQGNDYADANIIVKMLKENLEDYVQQAHNTIEQYELLTLVSDANNRFSEINVNYIKNHVSDPKLVQFLIESAAISATTGYVEKKNTSGVDLWSPVIFISKEELETMLGTLKEARSQAENVKNDALNINREPYLKALRSVVQTMIGDDPDKINAMTLDEITAMIGGLNVQTQGTGQKWTLNQLSDSKVVSDEQYRNILKGFKDKYDKLNGISKKYEYTIEFGESKYYWIPITVLP